LGASSMYAWQFCKALHVAREHGWTPFIAMQNHLNLLYREEEREMMGLCLAEGVGVTPWSPLARGRLTRPWQQATATPRGATDTYTRFLYTASEQADRAVIQAVTEVAAARSVGQAQIALAWLLGKPAVVAPIVGATSFQQLEDAVSAIELTLTVEEIAALEAPYVPHAVVEHT